MKHARRAGQLLTHLGPGWVAFRLRYALRKKSGALIRLAPLGTWAEDGAATAVRREPALFRQPVEVGEGCVAEAEAILAGRFRLFSHHERETGFPPHWHRNPLTGQSAPADLHWSRIGDFGSGDIKGVWELSRFPWAWPLARAYGRTGDERFAEGFWGLFENWLACNPPNRGAHWMCGQEATFRLIAATFSRHGLATAQATTPARVARFQDFVRATARRIAVNLDYALSQSNNHGVSECLGLITAAVILPDEADSAAWQARGLRALQQQLDALVYADGAFAQHSATYHRVLLHDLLWGVALLRSAGREVPAWWTDAAQRALGFIDALMTPATGRVPLYGANDGANILPLADADYLDFRPVVQAGFAVLYGVRRFAAGPWDEAADWLAPGWEAADGRRTTDDGGRTVAHGTHGPHGRIFTGGNGENGGRRSEGGGRRVGREDAQKAQKSEDRGQGTDDRGKAADRKGGPAAPRAADNGGQRIGREDAQEARKSESDCVTETTELGHRAGRRQETDRQGGPAAPRAADNGGQRIGREYAQKAQKTESEFVTEATELGHRAGRRQATDRPGGPATPRAANNGGQKIGREDAQKAQKSEDRGQRTEYEGRRTDRPGGPCAPRAAKGGERTEWVHFPEGGGALGRTGETRLFLRCPEKFLHRPSQADLLHVDLEWRGQPIALDAGTFSYNTPGIFAGGLKEAQYHNTLTLEGAEPLEKVGRFLYLPWPRGRAGWDQATGDFVATHDGWARLGLHHERRLGPSVLDRVVVTDRVRGAGRHRGRLHWLLADLPYRFEPLANRLILHTPAGDYALTWSVPAGKATLVRAAPASARGWWSPYYDYAAPALSLAVDFGFADAVEITTTFAPVGSSPKPPPK